VVCVSGCTIEQRALTHLEVTLGKLLPLLSSLDLVTGFDVLKGLVNNCCIRVEIDSKVFGLLAAHFVAYTNATHSLLDLLQLHFELVAVYSVGRGNELRLIHTAVESLALTVAPVFSSKSVAVDFDWLVEVKILSVLTHCRCMHL
jgi:hypothetical protein